MKLKHWDTKLIIKFAEWLIDKGEDGHGMLCLHAPSWGFKIGQQLNIKWSDVIKKYSKSDKFYSNKTHLILDNSEPIPLNFDMVADFNFLKVKSIDSYIYINYKTGTRLNTSTLNRELKKFSEEFLKDQKIDLPLKPLKTNSFEIAFAIDNVIHYNYSIEIFRLLSDYMGHRTVKHTIDLLELEPKRITKVKFNLVD